MFSRRFLLPKSSNIMKIMKIFYFTLLFAIVMVIFYLFCNSTSSNGLHDSLQRIPNSLRFPFIIAFSEEAIRNSGIRCSSLKRPNVNFIKDSWQSTRDLKLFFYSAYYDSRIKQDGKLKIFVRILGMSHGASTKAPFCQVWYKNYTSLVYQAQQEEIWFSDWDKPNSSQYYRPYIFSCPILQDSSPFIPPDSVSLVQKPCEEANHVLPINVPRTEIPQTDFVVCLKPMDFTDDRSLRLIEWLELQFLLGADKVSTYVYRVNPKVLQVLKYYESLGKVSIKNHTLPGREVNDPDQRSKYLKDNIWQKRRHEIIPYNDCFYDHVYTHNFVVILDLDEAIIPLMHDSWSELLDHIFSDSVRALQTYSSLSATNVYFFDTFGEYKEDTSIPPYMHMLRHVYRSANFSKPGFAVKSFFSTNNTLAVFNHYTLFPLYENLRRNALISRHLAQLHHYRANCPPLMSKECQTNFMKFYKFDTSIWKFKQKLIKNANSVLEELNFVS